MVEPKLADGCWIHPEIEKVFEEVLAPAGESGNSSTAVAADKTANDLHELELTASAAAATAVTATRRAEATEQAIDALIGSAADFLPFGQIANAVVGDLSAVVGARYGARLGERAATLFKSSISDQRETDLDGVVSDIPSSIAQAARQIHEAVRSRGPWVLLLGMNATDEDLAKAEVGIRKIEQTATDSVDAELMRRAERRRLEDVRAISAVDEQSLIEQRINDEAVRVRVPR